MAIVARDETRGDTEQGLVKFWGRLKVSCQPLPCPPHRRVSVPKMEPSHHTSRASQISWGSSREDDEPLVIDSERNLSPPAARPRPSQPRPRAAPRRAVPWQLLPRRRRRLVWR